MHLVFFANRKRLFQLRVFLSIPSGEWASLSVVGCQEEVVTPLQLGIPSDRICHATIYLHKFCKLAGGGMLTLGKGWNGLNIVGVTKASRNVMQNLMGTCLRWLRTRRRSRPCAPGQHEALDRAAFSLHPEDTLLAFMYDLYIVTMPDCAWQAFDTAAHAVEGQCGIASNLGKTHVFAAEVGPPPPGIAELGGGSVVWGQTAGQRGVVVLGMLVGPANFVQAWTSNPPRGAPAAGRAALPPRPPMCLAAPSVFRIASRKPCFAHTPTFGS